MRPPAVTRASRRSSAPPLAPALLALMVAGAPACGGAGAVPAPAGGRAESLIGATDVLEDPTGRLGIADVAAPPLAARFTPLDAARVNVGYTESAYWLRFTVDFAPSEEEASPDRYARESDGGAQRRTERGGGPAGLRPAGAGRLASSPFREAKPRFKVRSPGPALRYVEVYQSVDDIRLYERDRDGGDGWRERQFGRALPFHTRAIPHKSFYLPLASPDGGGPVVYHLRLRTADTLQLDLRLLAPEALAASVGASRLVAGLYFGVMGALALYNLLLFLCLRDRAYLYYVGFQVALGSLQAALDQLTFQLLWPEHPVWSAWSETLFVGLTLFCAAAFARHFLATPRGRAPWPGVLVAIQATSLALALACPLTSKVEFVIAAMVFVGLACLLLLAAGVVAWRRGVTNARFFVIAWAALLGGTVLVSLTATGVLSTTGIAQESTRLGSALEAVLLSLGLAHRINHMRRENERIQADLVRVRTEEAERLDRTVQERTRDLLGTLAELRRAQGQLVQQARLAALGHLVSGVIHEVGNPLNFIHGGTEDLVRRLDQVSDCLAAAARGGDRRADTIAEAEQTIAGAFTAAELIGNGNRRIGQIVENLRGFVSGRPAVQEPTDVADVIRRTAALMRPTLDPRGIALSLALEDLPEIVSSPGEIGQVLMNLMLNAAQAMPAGGSLHVAGRAVAGSLEIAVEDTGPGVPPGIRDAIFDPFFTTRPPNEGTGLGLSICHEIVSRHGGTLRLDEDHQPGARFVVRVPVPAPPRAIPGAAPGAGRAA